MHVIWSYPAYVAGHLPSFDWVMVFVALKDHPILNFLFEKRSGLVRNFGIGPFEFNLLGTEAGLGIVRYHVKRGNFEVGVAFVGVDSTFPFGNHSNVEFIHYIWQNVDMIGMQMQAMTILPGHPSQRFYIYDITWRRVWGWSTPSGCIGCTDQFRRMFAPLPRLCSTECAMHM